MEVLKYTTIDTLIEEVYRDYGFQVIPWNDAIEHVGRIMLKIGIPKVFAHKQIILDISNHVVELPCDIIDIVQIRELYSRQCLVYSTDSFILNQDNQIPPVNLPNYDWSEFQTWTYSDLDNNEINQSKYLLKQNVYQDVRNQALANENRITPLQVINKHTYFLNGGVLITSIKSGQLELSYKAFLTDKNGFPKIPDNEYYKSALTSYIAERICFKLWLQDKITENKYRKVEQNYHYDILACKSHMNTPTIDESETLKNSGNRLIIDMRSHSSGFKMNSEVESVTLR